MSAAGDPHGVRATAAKSGQNQHGSAPIMTIADVSKNFDMTRALSHVSLDLYPGEIHALIGENGAGKSTLIKIMTGIYRESQGAIKLDGEAVRINNARQAQALGIAAIYQEPMVFPDLDVAENIFISHRDRGAVVNWKRMYDDAADLTARLGVTLDVTMAASQLTLAEQQAVEIARAISLNVKVLIMDEPTASLSAHEVEQLMNVTRTLRNQGVAILYISHRLEEVFEIADRVSVLRDGEHISTKAIGDVTSESLISDMVGREIDDFFGQRSEREHKDVLMSVRSLGKQNVFSDVSFDVHRGEVLCFAGLIGSRRTDIGLALFGVEPADNGEIVFEGQKKTIRSPEQAIDAGIAYSSEDRRRLGLLMTMPITANTTLPTLRRYLSKLGLIKRVDEIAVAEDYREKLNVRTPSVLHEVGKLSGGNQQKVMLSKWLNTKPALLILDEPTRGIDVGAKAEVHQIINRLAADGVAIIMISSDLPEVLAMADRILVMREGRQMGIFDAREATQENIMSLATGQTVV